MGAISDKAKKHRRDYQLKYVKDTYMRIDLRIRNDEKEIIKHLKKQKSKNAYIIELIRKDIKK